MENQHTTKRKIKASLLFFTLMSVFVLITPKIYAQCDVSTGLIEHWKLNGNLSNSVSSHTAGSNSPAYTTDRLGNANGAISLGSWNSTLGTPVTINQTNYSYCLWLKRSGNNANSWAAVGAGNSSGMPLIVANNTNYGLNNGGGTFTYGTAPNTIGTWHHLVYTKSGTIAKLYYDGTLVATTTLISSFGLTNLAGVGTSNETVTGAYDEYRVYDHELTPAEITTIYNSTPAYTFAPLITVDPLPAFICGTQTVTLAALANGVGNTYQWQKDGVDVPGATNDTLVIPNASIADIGNYRLIATNTCGADTTASAQVSTINNVNLGSPIVYIPVLYSNNTMNFNDYSGNGLNASFTFLSTEADIEGTPNNVVVLNGGTHSGTIPHSNLMNVTNQVTLSCWFKASNIVNYQRLFDKYAASGNIILDVLNSKVRFLVAGGTHTIPNVLNSSTWYNVVATYNGAQVKIYINGILAYTGAQTGNCTSNTVPLRIGADQAGGNAFIGRLDEIRMYDRALSDVEAYGLYTGPKLATVPNSLVVCPGGSAALSTSGSGTGYAYQWNVNGSTITGATTANYTDNNVLAADTGLYSCAFTRGCYFMTIPLAKVNFPAAFSATGNLINHWPIDTNTTPAVGTTTLNLTNYIFGPNRFGVGYSALSASSIASSITVSAIISQNPKTISLWYNYSGSSTTSRSLLYDNNNNVYLLYISPTGVVGFNNNNTSVTLTLGQWYQFAVTVNGSAASLYMNGQLISQTTLTASGVTYFSNNNTGNQAAIGLLDDLRVYNSVLSLSDLYLLANAPGFTSQPQSQTLCPGQSATFTVVTSSSVTYQWKKNGNIIASATSSTYSIPSVVAGDAGSYTCEITDACSGSVSVSNAGVLTVLGSLSITQQTSATNNTPVCGSSVTFSVTATNASAYQWRKDGYNIINSTTSTYTIPAVAISSSGSYDCVITGCAGNVTSNPVALNVVPATMPTGLRHRWRLDNALTDDVASNNLTAISNYAFSYDRFNVNTKAVATSVAASGFTLTTPVRKDTITISLWYKASAITGYKTIIGDTAGRYGDMLTVINNELKWQKPGSGAQSTGITISAGYWYHIVITKQYTEMKFYLNGALAYTATNPAAVPIMGAAGNAGTQITQFGNTAPIYNNQNMNGALDDVRIYNGILTPSQISSIYSESEISSISNFTAACIGGSTSATVVANSLPTTLYQWQKAGVNIPGANSATLTISNVQAGDAGSYSCNVYSSQSCAVSTSSAIVLTPGAGNVSITSQPQPLNKCIGQAASFSVATSGATVTYQWKKNGTNVAGQTAATLNLAAVALADSGTYTCDIIGGSCGTISSTGAHLTVNAPATITIAPTTAAVCAGSSITLTASGGATYTWSNSGGTNAAATFSPSGNTTYTVTAIDANSCTATASKAVTVNAIPTASISPSTVSVCAGAAANLTASGGGTYAWSNSGGTSAAASFSPTTTSTYTVTVTANNCSATASRLVTVNALPTASITPSTAVSVCAGSPTTLTAAGGTSYAWSNSGGTAAAATFSPTTTSTYTVTVTANNCSATASKLVTVNALPLATLTPAAPAICAGASQTLTAGGGSSYAWSAGLGTGVSKSVSPTSTTMYTITATDANNCSASASATVSVTTVVAAINGPTTICSGLSATLTASGGGTYAWSNSLGSAAAVTVSPTTATTYTVTVTNNSCTATASQTVSVQSAPTAVINGASSVCAGSSITLTANGGNTYAWSNGGGNTASATFSPTSTTTYTVTASLGAGCTATATKTITIKQPTSGSYNQTICFGQSVLFNGISRTQSGAYLDTLVNLAGCDSFLTLNLTVRPQITKSIAQTVCFGGSTTFNGATLTQSGVFKDTLTSVTGCDSILTLTFTVRPRIATSITQPICNGSAINFNGQTITAAGAYLDTLTSVNGCDSFITLNVTIAQATAATISKSACGSYSFGGNTLTASGTYLDTISNVAGCDSVITLNLTINQATASTVYDTICNGDSYSFGAQTLNQSGAYNRTITNVAGCDSLITLNLFVRPAVAVTASASGFNVSATAGFVSYQWKLNGSTIGGANAQAYSAVVNGTYTVEVTDANGCKGTSNTVNVVGVGIENVSNISLNIYPNPATDIITIETDEQVTGAELFSAIGQKINVTINAKQQINISDLAAGAYSLIIHTTNGNAQKRFVKE
jgi:hypothetical protein